MKTPSLLGFLLIFIACCIFTWTAESTLCAVLAYIALVIIMVGIGKNLLGEPDV